jgi:hypothetical protein
MVAALVLVVAAIIYSLTGVPDAPPAPDYETLQAQPEDQGQEEVVEIRARHILFRTQGVEDEVQLERKEKKARELVEKLREGELEFAPTARKYSEGPTAEVGGDLDWFSRGQMVPEFDEAAFEADVGEIVGPVKTSIGWHIIQVVGRREPGGQPQMLDDWTESEAMPVNDPAAEDAPPLTDDEAEPADAEATEEAEAAEDTEAPPVDEPEDEETPAEGQ